MPNPTCCRSRWSLLRHHATSFVSPHVSLRKPRGRAYHVHSTNLRLSDILTHTEELTREHEQQWNTATRCIAFAVCQLRNTILACVHAHMRTCVHPCNMYICIMYIVYQISDIRYQISDNRHVLCVLSHGTWYPASVCEHANSASTAFCAFDADLL